MKVLLSKVFRGAGYSIALGISLIVLAGLVMSLVIMWIVNHDDVTKWQIALFASLIMLIVAVIVAWGVLSIFSSPLLKIH